MNLSQFLLSIKTHKLFSMKNTSKVKSSLNLKHILLAFFLLSLLIFILRSSYLSSSPPKTSSNLGKEELSCSKISPSLADTIIHYATTNSTPQQTSDEISVSARVLAKKSPCNFLVFGLGLDSLMWAALNHGGRTVFLEEDKAWIHKLTSKFPALETYHVTYNTKVQQAEELMELGRLPECTVVGDVRHSTCQLGLKELPNLFYEVEWDLIMVDAPTGYIPEAPGRMTAIYTAGMAARGRKEGETDVFVHDVDRVVEDKFSKVFLCEGYMKEQQGRLRHFTIPSHRDDLGKPFCP